MMPSSRPAARDGASRSQPANLPVHVRLFGERGPSFFLAAGLSVTLMTFLAGSALLYAPHHAPKAFGLLALSVFLLISGSLSRRIQAVAMGIMGGLIWSHLQVGPAPVVVAVSAVATALANYLCAAIVSRDLPALAGQTRRQRVPILARLIGAVVVSWGSVTAPGAVVVYMYLLREGWSDLTASLLVLGGVGLLAAMVCRSLADEIPGAADG